MKKFIILFILFTGSIFNSYSQNKTIEGRVISDQLENLPGVFIMIDDSIKIGSTDLNGFFKIDVPLSVNKISYKGIGIEPANIILSENCDYLEVLLLLSSSQYFATPRCVNLKRKNRYKLLNKVHKKAFANGMFQTKLPCYIRVL
jgi:hypothetical protein